jgi:hypothetical protein
LGPPSLTLLAMVCWSVWLLGLTFVAAVVLGFALCFVWHWWVLSNARAEAKPDSRVGAGRA